jgi:hypothetical protein
MVSIRRAIGDGTGGGRVALVLPGAGYTAQAPLLYWPIRALAQAGCDVWTIDWHADIDDAARRDMRGFVEAALARAEKALPAAPRAIIAKSLGTFALPYFAGQDVNAVWLTPILTDPEVAAALALASGRHLAIGGSADPAWRPDLVGSTSAQLVTVDDADHGLERDAAHWRESAETQLSILDRVITHLVG